MQKNTQFLRYMGPSLLCNGHGLFNTRVRVALYRDDKPGFLLQAELQNMLPARLQNMQPARRGAVRITEDAFVDRPYDASLNTVQATWALEMCGFIPCELGSDD
jgi:hypothetical protein